ncbi:MAG: hypothetical protein II998_09765 [Clostridia bacterium]|nr:hypothetical protein [Clostridia bacterium]
MKKVRYLLLLFSLMIFFTACSSGYKAADDIYKKIHSRYYDIDSYSVNCTITSYTNGEENNYECFIKYDKDKNSYCIGSDGMTIEITDDKTIVSKGDNVLETQTQNSDMPIFINTFFKSYYQSENTSMSVSADSDRNYVLLECDAVNSDKLNSGMKLWIDKKSVKPKKMQITDSEGNMHMQILFKDFKFIQNV